MVLDPACDPVEAVLAAESHNRGSTVGALMRREYDDRDGRHDRERSDRRRDDRAGRHDRNMDKDGRHDRDRILTGIRRATIAPGTQTGTGKGTMTDLATGMSGSGKEAEREAESA